MSALLASVFAPSWAQAQIVQLDPEIPRSVTLSPEQTDAIDVYIDAYGEKAFDADRGEAARAIDELIGPLQGEGVSVSFRTAYAERLIDLIESALAEQAERIPDSRGNDALNHRPYYALRLASNIATDSMLVLIEDEFTSDNEGRRYFAIYAIETIFNQMRENAPAVTSSTVLSTNQGGASTGLIADLGKMLVEEKSGKHAAAIVRALAEAARLPEEVVPGASRTAMRLIADGSAARVRNHANREKSHDETIAWLTASQEVVRRITQPGNSDAQTGLAAIRLGGQLIASVLEDLEAKRVAPAGERETAPSDRLRAQTLGVASNLILFGEQNASDDENRRPSEELRRGVEDLESAFREGRDSDFRRAALELISRNGLLTDRPYGFSDDEFIVE